MNIKNTKDDTYKMIEILQNATIIYSDGVKEQFEAIRLIDKGVIIGRIIDGEIVEYGYISKNSIKEIKRGVKKNIRKMKA